MTQTEVEPRPTTGGRPRMLVAAFFPRTVTLEGVGTFIRGIAAEMLSRGWDVHVLTPTGKPLVGSPVVSLFYDSGLKGIFNYRKALKAASKDADAVLLVESNPVMGFTARWSAKPQATLTYFLTPLATPSDLRRAGLTKQSIKHGIGKSRLLARPQSWGDRRFAAATEYQAKQIRSLGASHITVLPGAGFTASRPVPDRETAREQLGWDDKPVYGYLGHYSPAKGVGVLIDAADHLADTGAVLGLAYSGKGKLSAEHDAKRKALIASGRARELGVVDPLLFLAACDVTVLPYVSPSIYHLPQVMLESFAASTPVVTTDVGGMGELIRPNVTGLLAPPGDAPALAAAIRQMLADPSKREESGRVCRDIFERELAVNVFCDRVLAMLAPGVTPPASTATEGAAQ